MMIRSLALAWVALAYLPVAFVMETSTDELAATEFAFPEENQQITPPINRNELNSPVLRSTSAAVEFDAPGGHQLLRFQGGEEEPRLLAEPAAPPPCKCRIQKCADCCKSISAIFDPARAAKCVTDCMVGKNLGDCVKLCARVAPASKQKACLDSCNKKVNPCIDGITCDPKKCKPMDPVNTPVTGCKCRTDPCYDCCKGIKDDELSAECMTKCMKGEKFDCVDKCKKEKDIPSTVQCLENCYKINECIDLVKCKCNKLKDPEKCEGSCRTEDCEKLCKDVKPLKAKQECIAKCKKGEYWSCPNKCDDDLLGAKKEKKCLNDCFKVNEGIEKAKCKCTTKSPTMKPTTKSPTMEPAISPSPQPNTSPTPPPSQKPPTSSHSPRPNTNPTSSQSPRPNSSQQPS